MSNMLKEVVQQREAIKSFFPLRDMASGIRHPTLVVWLWQWVVAGGKLFHLPYSLC